MQVLNRNLRLVTQRPVFRVRCFRGFYSTGIKLSGLDQVGRLLVPATSATIWSLLRYVDKGDGYRQRTRRAFDEAKPQARDRKGDDTVEIQEIEGDGDAEARAAERRVVRLSD